MDPHTRPPQRRQRRRATIVVALGAALLVTAACTAGNGQAGGSNNHTTGHQPKTMGKPYRFGVCCAWGTSWAYNPYTSQFPGFPTGYFIYQPLAVRQPPKLTDFKPALADKWTIKGNRISVHIQDGQKCENGTAVTSGDLMNTILLDAIRGSALMNDISSAHAVDKSTVRVTVRDQTPTDLALIDLLGTTPLPKSVYGKFIGPDLKKQIFAYYNQYAEHPGKADKSKAKKNMDRAFKKLSKFKPDKMLGDGPFKLKSMNTQKANLEKSKTYVDADKIRIPKLIYVNGQRGNEALYPPLVAKKLDFSTAYLTGPIAKKLSKVQGYHATRAPAFMYAMYFNSHNGPTSDESVRKALAYVMDREKMIRSAYGTVNPGGEVEQHPDGILPDVEKQYLSKSQIGQLNQYKPDKHKATKLLEQAGYKKHRETWMTPSGKPLKLTMTVNQATGDIVTSFKSAAADLTDFGIKTDVRAVQAAKMDRDLASGRFEITQGFPNNLDPLQGIESVIGQGNNFMVSGEYKGERGMGFGPTMKVPDQGKINVPRTISKQAHSVGSGKNMKRLTWSWARLVNQKLPYLQYGNKTYQFSYYENNYTHYPPKGSPLWKMIGANFNTGFVEALREGYIIPR